MQFYFAPWLRAVDEQGGSVVFFAARGCHWLDSSHVRVTGQRARAWQRNSQAVLDAAPAISLNTAGGSCVDSAGPANMRLPRQGPLGAA